MIANNCERSKKEYQLSEYYQDRGKPTYSGEFINVKPLIDLSIIIPVYNVSKYIIDCLTSIVSQVTKYDYEIIIVNDGSTDETIDLISDFLDNGRVCLVNQENAGQSAARNRAISLSKGKYIMFVDGDDILIPNAIETLMDVAIDNCCDIVEGNLVKFSKEITLEMINESVGKEHIESYKSDPKFVLNTFGYSWAKVYKRELWNTLRFPEGYIFEDVITKFILRRKANCVIFIKDVVYGYRQNFESSSHSNNHTKKLDSIYVFPKIVSLCELENVPKDDIFYLLSLNHIGILNYCTIKSHDENVRIACFSEMRKQLLSIQDYRPKTMPLMFRLLDKSILDDNMKAWEYISQTITDCNMLKKWREID